MGSTRPFSVWPNTVRHYRELAGLKQTELAERVAISAPDLSIIEAGYSLPTIPVRDALADALQTPAWMLWPEVDHAPGVADPEEKP